MLTPLGSASTQPLTCGSDDRPVASTCSSETGDPKDTVTVSCDKGDSPWAPVPGTWPSDRPGFGVIGYQGAAHAAGNYHAAARFHP